jgi:hypothetical protein
MRLLRPPGGATVCQVAGSPGLTGYIKFSGLTLARARIEDANNQSNSFLLTVNCLIGRRRETAVSCFRCKFDLPPSGDSTFK